MLASFNRRRRMKAESRQIPQKLAARLKFVCCRLIVVVIRFALNKNNHKVVEEQAV